MAYHKPRVNGQGPIDDPASAPAHDHPPPTQPLPLLTTKLYIPPVRPNLVARPRLTDRLQAGVSSSLTLIVAPAGFGKTTLVSAWHAAVDKSLPLAWVALDAGDNDPIRFWSYVISALSRLQTGLGAAVLAQLQSPQPPPLEGILTTLLNTLVAQTTDLMLVLDDYHLIDNPAVHQTLTFLLDHLPPCLHVVIVSRADPPLALSRLRARGELVELRAADLRFTPDEAAAFLIESMQLPLSADHVAALERRTEGWIAGLQFAALAIRDHTDLNGFIARFTGSNRFVVDYLAEEVLLRLPQHVQTFLLQTSILDRMCGALCDALLSLQDAGPSYESTAQSTLEQLERMNLFIFPLDDTRQWYRYHHLFVDVLRGRLKRGASAEQVATLHRRASTWFEAQGLVAEAVQHALAANDSEQAARLVELHGEGWWMRGGLTTLLTWLTALPDGAFTARPALALNHAFILAALDNFALSEHRLAAAERALNAAPTPDTRLLGQAAMVRTAIALLAEHPAEETIRAGLRALELLPASNTGWRSHACMMLGVGYYAQAGDIELGLRTLAEAERIALVADDAFTVANAAAHRAIALEIGGRLRESAELNQHYLQRASEPFWQGVPLAGYARFGLSRVLYERNDLHLAREHLSEALGQLEAWSLKRPVVITLVMLARVHQALGEMAVARPWMERAVAIVRKDALKQTFSHWGAYGAQIDLAQGDLATASQWAREIEPTIIGDLNPAYEFDHLTLARVYLAQQRFDDAQRLLAHLLPAAEAAGRMGRALAILVLQALTAAAQGDQRDALIVLARALTLAEPQGYVRIFVDEGAPMAALLRAAAQRGIAPSYVAGLLAAFPQAGEQTARQGEPDSLSLVEPLSARELEILRLIAAGHSNQVIADALVIAVSTVKRHINNIYGKLAVQSRTQALVRARQLRLL